MCAYPFDAIHTGDDWGQQHGLIMGPDLWRKFIKPQVKRMYERSKSHGKVVSIHSCGDIREVLGDLETRPPARQIIGMPVNFIDKPEYERELAAIRAEAGEDAFQSAWGKGQALDLNQAVRLATEHPFLPATS